MQKLEKPFAVLEKVRGSNEAKTEYSVKAVIKRKLCFRERPKPIVGAFTNSSNPNDTEELVQVG